MTCRLPRLDLPFTTALNFSPKPNPACITNLSVERERLDSRRRDARDTRFNFTCPQSRSSDSPFVCSLKILYVATLTPLE